MEPYDRAIIGGVKFATVQTGKRKHSCDSVVLMQDDGVLWADRDGLFLTNRAPGHVVDGDEEVYTAHVKWFGKVPRKHAICTHGLSCVKVEFHDDKHGNMWPMEKLAPVKLATVR